MPLAIFRIVLLTVIVHIGCIINRVTCQLDALQAHATALEVGIMMALFALIPAFFAIQCGAWVDRVGPKKPIITGIVLAACGAALPAFLRVENFGLAPLYVASMINGLGMMLMALTTQQFIGHLSNAKNRTANFAMLAMGFSTANLIAPIISGYFIDGFSFRATYLVAVGTAFLGLTLFATAIGAIIPPTWGRAKPKAHHSSFELFKIPHVRNVLIVSSFMSMAWDLQSFMIPVYGNAIGLTATQIGWVLGAFASATFVVRLFMPWIARRLTEWQTIRAAFGFGTLAYLFFPIFTDFYVLCLNAFVLGLALGSSQPNVMSLLHTQSPHGRVGEALGLRSMMINVCHTSLPIIFGAAGAAVGAGAVFYTVAALMAGVTGFTSYCQKVAVDEDETKEAS